MKKTKNYRVVGKINGVEVIKEFENEYTAEACAKTLNEVFAPFVVEEIKQEEMVPTLVAAPDGSPF